MIVKSFRKLLENGDVTTTTHPSILIYKRWSSITVINLEHQQYQGRQTGGDWAGRNPPPP